jgi:hypothetical protein
VQLPEVKKMAQQETRNPIRKRWTEKLKMLEQMAEVKRVGKISQKHQSFIEQYLS